MFLELPRAKVTNVFKAFFNDRFIPRWNIKQSHEHAVSLATASASRNSKMNFKQMLLAISEKATCRAELQLEDI